MLERNPIYRFLTHSNGRGLTSGVILDRRDRDPVHSPDELCGLVRLSNEQPAACAHGKIVVLLQNGVHTYQSMPDGRVLPAFCGNSTAAALRLMGSQTALAVHGPASQQRLVDATLSRNTVLQSWISPAPAIETRRWRGRNVLIVRVFNDYAILSGKLPSDVDAATALHEIFGPFGCPKLVVLEPGPSPLGAFYNTNGRHGGAPQTGLASLAVLARFNTWVKGLVANGTIAIEREGRRETILLPDVARHSSGGLRVRMPIVQASVTIHRTEAAA